MTFTHRIPPVQAELHVDYQAHYDHVTDRRTLVETAAVKTTRQIAYTVAELGLAPRPKVQQLAASLNRSLDATARFGYGQARREIRSQRATLAYSVPDSGDYADAAREGLAGIRDLIRRRAHESADAIAAAALAVLGRDHDSQDALLLAVTQMAARVLHNHVLELVGETLNLGRAAGALSFDRPPEFALRSEQLDKNTCDPCGRLHGLIAQVGSDEFYANTPPSGCLGGGRCRGIWVFSDDAAQVLVREAA